MCGIAGLQLKNPDLYPRLGELEAAEVRKRCGLMSTPTVANVIDVIVRPTALYDIAAPVFEDSQRADEAAANPANIGLNVMM